MHEQVVLNLRQAVKDEIKKQDLDNKEYGFSIARDLYNMTMIDVHKYFDKSIASRLSLGSLTFEEAEAAVLKWREKNENRV